MTLDGKVALVTGGSRGIGAEIAAALSADGAHVVFTYLKEVSAAQTVAARIQANGGCCAFSKMDVTRSAEVQSAVNLAVERFGGIDILVNNAGINKPEDFDRISERDFDAVLAVNLKGPFFCCQRVLPEMRKRGGGSIINIGSVSGQYGGPRTAHYAASKAALISLGQVVARFAAKDNIRCNTIAAGLIASEMADAGLKSAAVAAMTQGILLGRLGTPNDVARAVLFLAGDDAGYITGQTLNVNGGLYF